MGTDIHMYVEVRDKLVPDRWASVDKWTGDKVAWEDLIYKEKNPYLNAILAGVNNEEGEYKTISPPKGLPANTSSKVKAVFDRRYSPYHTPSYLTLEEVLNYDWTTKVEFNGFIPVPDFVEWDRFGRWEGDPPNNIYRHHRIGVDTANYQYVEAEKARDLVNQYMAYNTMCEALADHYVHAEWHVTYARLCQRFWWTVVPYLVSLGEPDEVRIVFWFDH